MDFVDFLRFPQETVVFIILYSLDPRWAPSGARLNFGLFFGGQEEAPRFNRFFGAPRYEKYVKVEG